MKGQTNVVASLSTVLIVAVFIIVGAMTYSYLAKATPHDTQYLNESVCTTCVAHTLYALDYFPVNNDSTLKCSNASGTVALIAATSSNTSKGFTLYNGRYINLSQNGGASSAYSNVKCDYYHDLASSDQQGFWDNTTENAFSGFVLASVAVIVLVAVGIIGIVLMLKD